MSNNHDSLIKLQTLQKEYEVTLQKYQEAVKNYISTVDSSDSNQVFQSIPNSTWWGSASANDTYAYTAKSTTECEAICTSIAKCTGATFKSSVSQCYPRKGSGVITASDSDGDYAIVQTKQVALATMQYLNKQLLKLSNDMNDMIKNYQPYLDESLTEKDTKHEELKDAYTKLLQQKKEMDDKIQESYTLEENDTITNLQVVQSSMVYTIAWFICVFVIFMTVRILFGLEEAMPISFFIKILIFIMLTMNMNSPVGFLLWLIYIIILILKK
jgi:PAN domain